MIVRLIHGIHSKEGDNNMSTFAPLVEKAMPGARVSLFEYGFMGFWAARWKNNDVAANLAEIHRFGQARGVPEVWATHSNGAAIAYLAVTKFGAAPDMIINFNPALDRWRTADVPRVETIHSNSDRWVNLSQWLPGHIWGDQGKVGYTGKNGNTINHNASLIGGRMAYNDHTGAFAASRREAWAYFVANRVDEFLGNGLQPGLKL